MGMMTLDPEISIRTYTMEELLGRPLTEAEKLHAPKVVYYAGKLPVPLTGLRVSVIGTRWPKFPDRVRKLIPYLVKNKIMVVSGLAKGVDTLAHMAAIYHGGKTIAVLGTPLDIAYPARNMSLQLRIMKEHAAISQFPSGHPIKPWNFPKRNLTMALISHATIVIEARTKSGTVYQCWECIRLGRPLFIHRSLADLPWVKMMLLRRPIFFDTPDEIMDVLWDLGIDLSWSPEVGPLT